MEATRRALLGAIASLPTLIATPASAGLVADPRDEMTLEQSYEHGHEIAMLRIARAWLDRWEAVGGHFGLSYNRDGSIRSVLRGRPEPNWWTPTDEGNEQLPPHTWLVEPRHQQGAVKALEGLLELVPGLSDKVLELGGYYSLVAGLTDEA